MRRASLLPVVVCLFSLTMAAQAQESAPDAMPMHEVEIDWHTAQTTKNLPMMMALFADDARFTVGGKTFSGKAQIEQFWRANPVFKPENQFVAYTPPARFNPTRREAPGTLLRVHPVGQDDRRHRPAHACGRNADMVRVNGDC